MGAIYAILNTVDQKQYVGSTINPVRRQKEHFRDLRAKRHYNRHLQNAFNKYGQAAFSWVVLQEADSNLLELEEEWIKKLQTTDGRFGYNVSDTPMSPMRGRKHTDQTKQLYSEQRRGLKHPNCKINENVVRQIFNLYKQGHNQSEISKIVGTHNSNVSLILRGKAWAHLGLSVDVPRTNNTSGCVGIYFSTAGKWVAEIIKDKQWICLGRFDRKEDAVVARKLAEGGQDGV